MQAIRHFIEVVRSLHCCNRGREWPEAGGRGSLTVKGPCTHLQQRLPPVNPTKALVLPRI